jgi:hypothetical protein
MREILVVVVLLVILAAITAPQMSRASTEDYRFHQNDLLPAATTEVGGSCPERIGKVFKIQTKMGRHKI